ncbi:hypothetical protein Tco_0524952, partial [Tanacetum coccineum]
AQYKREYDSWVNKIQKQKTEEKVDSSKALDASLADTESSRTSLKVQDTSIRSGNDTHADDADIIPIYDEEPMAKGRMPTKIELTLEQSQQGVSNDVLHYGRSYALSWKPCQGDSLNLPDHRIHKDGDGDASFQLKSDSLPHAHAQTTKTFYKHQDSRIMKAQELKTKTSAQTLIYKIFLQRYQVYQGRLLASFQDDAKYEHVGQDTRSQGGKDDQDGRIKI